MRNIRTLEQITTSQYISLTEIQRLMGYGYRTATKIYKAAESIDIAEMEYRPVDTRVRIKSVYKVLGIKNGTLLVDKTGIQPETKTNGSLALEKPTALGDSQKSFSL